MTNKNIVLIACIDEGNGLGYKGNLLANIPSDLKYFKEATNGYSVIMGRKTFESIGKPLPNRENIVVTTSKKSLHSGIIQVDSPDKALDIASKEIVFIIGGAGLYSYFMEQATALLITKIHKVFEKVDTVFPKINLNRWRLVGSDFSDKEGEQPITFQRYLNN